ncbi:hypothetical protein P9D80_03250 [Bacillus spizizenii]|nr:hypothetical protein [Bacillus spizizenii]MEC1584381.1 hypothetical protein [Bacillus spizizenii]
MTETNAKIHVLADETLGGIKREYVEVGRDISARSMGRYVQFTETPNLEPTDIVHIDGERYQMVNRKAKIGEKVICNGNIATVKSVSGGFVKVDEYEDAKGDVIGGFSHGLYRVLVPVEAEADEPQPVDTIDAIANLATRVADLERTIKRQKDEIDTLHKDNRTLGEELARLKEPAKNESIIESAPFVVVIHEGRGEFDVYQRGKKIENISRLEIEAYSRLSSSIDLEFNDVGERP